MRAIRGLILPANRNRRHGGNCPGADATANVWRRVGRGGRRVDARLGLIRLYAGEGLRRKICSEPAWGIQLRQGDAWCVRGGLPCAERGVGGEKEGGRDGGG